MRDRRDRADDAERGVLDDRQAVVTAENLAPHELDARSSLAQGLEFFDFVLEAANLGFLEFGFSEFFRLVDADASNALYSLAAFFKPARLELPLRFYRCSDRGIHVVEYA